MLSSNGALPELDRGLLREEGAGSANVLAKRSLFNDDEFEGPKMLSVSDDITPSLVPAPPNSVDVDMVILSLLLLAEVAVGAATPNKTSRITIETYVFLHLVPTLKSCEKLSRAIPSEVS